MISSLVSCHLFPALGWVQALCAPCDNGVMLTPRYIHNCIFFVSYLVLVYRVPFIGCDNARTGEQTTGDSEDTFAANKSVQSLILSMESFAASALR